MENQSQKSMQHGSMEAWTASWDSSCPGTHQDDMENDMCSSGNATGKGGSIPKCKVPNHLSPGRGNCPQSFCLEKIRSFRHDTVSKSTDNKVVSHEQCWLQLNKIKIVCCQYSCFIPSRKYPHAQHIWNIHLPKTNLTKTTQPDHRIDTNNANPRGKSPVLRWALLPGRSSNLKTVVNCQMKKWANWLSCFVN